MSFNNIISKKLNSKKLEKEEIETAIYEIVQNLVPDYQISVLLASIYINGMSDEELFYLTDSICNSGEIISFEKSDYIIDKHSTGGVGDKVTLIIAPILASFGIKIAKISGRGLGITGGTIDKLNSVGIKTNISLLEAKKFLKKYNMFIIEQTKGLVPADQILYKLRDVTSTIDSIPLIVSSIMSKKFAIESNHIYLDVKVGKGAFFKTKKQAELFVKKVMNISIKKNRKITCTLTKMDKPLGLAIGNRLEVYEALNFLNGIYKSKNLKKLITFFIGEILLDKKIVFSMKDASKKIDEMIDSKKPLNLFLNYAEELGFPKIQNFDNLIKAKNIQIIKTKKSGYFVLPNAYEIGLLALEMKAGRKYKNDEIDPFSGILFLLDENQKVEKNQPIAQIYSSFEIKKEWVTQLNKLIKISDIKEKNSKTIIGTYNEK